MMMKMMTEISLGQGTQNLSAPLKQVLVRPPGNELRLSAEQSRQYNYLAPVNWEKACLEHQNFCQVMEDAGVEVCRVKFPTAENLADAVFVHDSALLSEAGFIQLRMGKKERVGEEIIMAEVLRKKGITQLGTLQAPDTCEGGDTLFLTPQMLLVGTGHRTTPGAVVQLRAIFAQNGVSTVEVVEIPLLSGPPGDGLFHLQSVISIIGKNLALICQEYTPPALLELLMRQGLDILRVPVDEYSTQGPNVLCLGDGKVLALAGSPKTKKLMEEAGLEVFTYCGEEISHKMEGGPTCLTRPLLRQL